MSGFQTFLFASTNALLKQALMAFEKTKQAKIEQIWLIQTQNTKLK